MIHRRALLPLLLLAAACGRNDSAIGHFMRVTHLVPEGATSFDAKVQLIGGYLKIAPIEDPESAGQHLCALDLGTNLPELVPTPMPAIQLQNGVAKIEVAHPQYRASWGRAKNEWRIGLGAQLPTNLVVGLMSGICEVKLGGLNCTRVEARVEQGQLVIDCAGAPLTTSCEVIAEIGTGQVRVRYPADPTIGVRVRGRKAVGGVVITGLREVGADKDIAYVNDAFETAAIKLDLALGSGFGEVVVEPATNP